MVKEKVHFVVVVDDDVLVVNPKKRDIIQFMKHGDFDIMIK
jgi:hypothetical protein